MSRQADADMVAWSRSQRMLGVRFEMDTRGVEDVLLERAPREGEDPRTGKVTAIETARMPIYDRFKVTRTAALPEAYIVPASEKKMIELLLRHGVVVEKLRQDFIGDFSKFTVAEVVQARNAFQGHRLVRLEGRFATEGGNVAAGAYIVRTGQPLGIIVFELLEPESLDGAVAWEAMAALPTVGSVLPIWKVYDTSKAVSEIVTIVD
jgi:hypothetical protein